jgi:3-polyprenyl-4-hydroxybenzoate decarboxylase
MGPWRSGRMSRRVVVVVVDNDDDDDDDDDVVLSTIAQRHCKVASR